MTEPVSRDELLDVVCVAFADGARPDRAGLLEAAHHCGARPGILNLLTRLPEARRFSGPRNLWEELPDVPLEPR